MKYDYKVKVITNYRREEGHSISADEAHKAYYLFLHPEQRGIFNSGVALIGSQIQEIIPDWHGTMGWNQTHRITSDDWNEIHKSGIGSVLNKLCAAAKEIAAIGSPEDMGKPLTALIEQKYPQLAPKTVERREGAMKQIGEVLPKI